jgi:hypothetical protein
VPEKIAAHSADLTAVSLDLVDNVNGIKDHVQSSQITKVCSDLFRHQRCLFYPHHRGFGPPASGRHFWACVCLWLAEKVQLHVPRSSGCVYVDMCWGAQGGKMLSFFMLDFAGSLLMNIAEAILKLKYAYMSLETAVDAAFGCVHCLTLGARSTCARRAPDAGKPQRQCHANGFCMTMAAMEVAAMHEHKRVCHAAAAARIATVTARPRRGAR